MDGASLPILKIGSLLGMNSSIGVVALNAMQLAVEDVNAHKSILPNHQLYLETMDSACDAFQGAASGKTTLLLAPFIPWLPILPLLPFSKRTPIFLT